MRPLLLPRPENMNWAHVYRGLAGKADIHAITQRADAGKTTLIMEIARSRLPSAKTALDIGCGDGQLLRSINAELRVGTTVSEEEAARLRRNYQGCHMEFYAARAETLDMGRTFNLICAVGVLQHLGKKKTVRAALTSMRNTLDDGGHLYVGVLPQLKTPPKLHTSTLRALGFVRRTSGTLTAIGFLRRLWRRKHRMGLYEVPRLPQYASGADEFINLASECGFDFVQKWPCADFGTDDDRQRMDYLFRAG